MRNKLVAQDLKNYPSRARARSKWNDMRTDLERIYKQAKKTCGYCQLQNKRAESNNICKDESYPCPLYLKGLCYRGDVEPSTVFARFIFSLKDAIMFATDMQKGISNDILSEANKLRRRTKDPDQNKEDYTQFIEE